MTIADGASPAWSAIEASTPSGRAVALAPEEDGTDAVAIAGLEKSGVRLPGADGEPSAAEPFGLAMEVGPPHAASARARIRRTEAIGRMAYGFVHCLAWSSHPRKGQASSRTGLNVSDVAAA